MTEVDPNAAAEQASLKWGPDFLRARWLIENEFPDCMWTMAGEEPDQFVATLLKDGGKEFSSTSTDPIWALCLTMQQAADAGLYQPIPPPPAPNTVKS